MHPHVNPEKSQQQSIPTILVLDENPKDRKSLSDILCGEERKVHTAATSKEAMEHLNHGVVPDLVLLDLMLPGAGGMEFLDLFRRRYPAMKTIVISARDDVDTVVEAMRLGALDFLRKPFEPTAVLVSVNEALQFRELEQELERIKRQLTFSEHMPFLYSSHPMAVIMESVQQAAPTNVPVLITGESGVGKEVVAREIHHRSERAQGPFVKVNCAALPATLLESELFGFEKGAFTGAFKTKPSKFEKAQDGTLFLDEIGDLEGGIQSKFLHVLQDGSYTRLGSNKVFQSNARIVVATNRDLEEAVHQKSFRSDLYYRLNVIRIHVPPLRERPSDIPLLAEHFLNSNNRKFGKSLTLTPEMIERLMRYSWPGNVRELQNAMSRYAVLGKISLGMEGLESAHPVPAPSSAVPVQAALTPTPQAQPSAAREDPEAFPVRSLKEVAKEAMRKAERTAILGVLETTHWNKSKAARILQISYKALLYKIKDCGIEETGS